MKHFCTIIILFAVCAFGQSSVQKPDDANGAFKPNATTAALLSLAVPGAGQIYARSYLHSPVFIAAESYCAWRAIDAANSADDFWSKRDNLIAGTYEYDQARNEFDYYVKERNTYLWFLVGVKFLDIADAYISAQLFDFDEQMKTPVSNSQTAFSTRKESPFSLFIAPEPKGARLVFEMKF
jgi:hypothetical protein